MIVYQNNYRALIENKIMVTNDKWCRLLKTYHIDNLIISIYTCLEEERAVRSDDLPFWPANMTVSMYNIK